jgi:hypothetical protein
MVLPSCDLSPSVFLTPWPSALLAASHFMCQMSALFASCLPPLICTNISSKWVDLSLVLSSPFSAIAAPGSRALAPKQTACLSLFFPCTFLFWTFSSPKFSSSRAFRSQTALASPQSLLSNAPRTLRTLRSSNSPPLGLQRTHSLPLPLPIFLPLSVVSFPPLSPLSRFSLARVSALQQRTHSRVRNLSPLSPLSPLCPLCLLFTASPPHNLTLSLCRLHSPPHTLCRLNHSLCRLNHDVRPHSDSLRLEHPLCRRAEPKSPLLEEDSPDSVLFQAISFRCGAFRDDRQPALTLPSVPLPRSPLIFSVGPSLATPTSRDAFRAPSNLALFSSEPLPIFTSPLFLCRHRNRLAIALAQLIILFLFAQDLRQLLISRLTSTFAYIYFRAAILSFNRRSPSLPLSRSPALFCSNPEGFSGPTNSNNCSFWVSRPTSLCAHPSLMVGKAPVGASLFVFAPLSSRVLVMSSLTAPSGSFSLAAPLRGCVGPTVTSSRPSYPPLVRSVLSMQLWWLAPSHALSSHSLYPLPPPSSSIDPSILLLLYVLVVLVSSLGCSRPLIPSIPSCSLYTLSIPLSTLSFYSIHLCSPCVNPFSWLGSHPLVPLHPHVLHPLVLLVLSSHSFQSLCTSLCVQHQFAHIWGFSPTGLSPRSLTNSAILTRSHTQSKPIETRYFVLCLLC